LLAVAAGLEGDGQAAVAGAAHTPPPPTHTQHTRRARAHTRAKDGFSQRHTEGTVNTPASEQAGRHAAA
jgi:hypothetical protein